MYVNNNNKQIKNSYKNIILIFLISHLKIYKIIFLLFIFFIQLTIKKHQFNLILLFLNH